MRKYENNVEDMIVVIRKRFEKMAEKEAEDFIRGISTKDTSDDLARAARKEFMEEILARFEENMAVFCNVLDFVCNHPDSVEEGEVLKKESVDEILRIVMELSFEMFDRDLAKSLTSDILSGKINFDRTVGDSVSVSVIRL